MRRLRQTLNSQQPREQAGFRQKYSTIDHIFTVSQIIERYNEYKLPLYIAFIDYSKAFDSISHRALWRALKKQGIETKYIELLQAIYKNSRATVKLDRMGASFPIKRGVRQGDPISPNLFTALLEEIFSNLSWDHLGININGEYLNHLRFADDIVLISGNHEDLYYMLKTLDQESQKCGLVMNFNKTCIMTNSAKIYTMIHTQTIDYVEEYTYLGQNISFADNTIKEVERRIKIAWRKYWSLKHIFKAKIPIKLKKRAMESTILPTLLYGCQTWSLTKRVVEKVKVFQRATERSMLGIKLRDRQRNENIRSQTQVKDAAEFACELKWRWAGHVARTGDGRWSERILHWWPRDQTRPRGRPRARWRDDIQAVAGNAWTRLAKERSQWSKMEEAYTRRWVPKI